MALFGEKQTKEEKEQKQMQDFMHKYQLDDLDQDDLIVLKRIATDLAGNGLLKAGMALSFAKAEEQAKVTYLSALVEQNWMIIRQLGKLNKNIEKISNK
jgi:beta-N-acetylglucosaminidase